MYGVVLGDDVVRGYTPLMDSYEINGVNRWVKSTINNRVFTTTPPNNQPLVS